MLWDDALSKLENEISSSRNEKSIRPLINKVEKHYNLLRQTNYFDYKVGERFELMLRLIAEKYSISTIPREEFNEVSLLHDKVRKECNIGLIGAHKKIDEMNGLIQQLENNDWFDKFSHYEHEAMNENGYVEGYQQYLRHKSARVQRGVSNYNIFMLEKDESVAFNALQSALIDLGNVFYYGSTKTYDYYRAAVYYGKALFSADMMEESQEIFDTIFYSNKLSLEQFDEAKLYLDLLIDELPDSKITLDYKSDGLIDKMEEIEILQSHHEKIDGFEKLIIDYESNKERYPNEDRFNIGLADVYCDLGWEFRIIGEIDDALRSFSSSIGYSNLVIMKFDEDYEYDDVIDDSDIDYYPKALQVRADSYIGIADMDESQRDNYYSKARQDVEEILDHFSPQGVFYNATLSMLKICYNFDEFEETIEYAKMFLQNLRCDNEDEVKGNSEDSFYDANEDEVKDYMYSSYKFLIEKSKKEKDIKILDYYWQLIELTKRLDAGYTTRDMKLEEKAKDFVTLFEGFDLMNNAISEKEFNSYIP